MNEMVDLIDAYLDGDITDADFQAFQSWLEADADHVAQFIERSSTHSQCRKLFRRIALQNEYATEYDLVKPTEQAIENLFADVHLSPEIIEQQIAKQKELSEDSSRLRSIVEQQLKSQLKLHEAKQKLPTKKEETTKSSGGMLFSFGGVNVFRADSNQYSSGIRLSHLIAAMLVGIGLMVGWFYYNQTPPPTPSDKLVVATKPFVVATVTKTMDAKWTLPIHEGSQIVNEATMQLTSGFAELTFESGAKVLLEAPCRFVLKSENAMRMTRGKMVALVPYQAQGFTVITPNAYLVDYGTEFGVEVNQDGSVDAVVFQGEIELSEVKPTPEISAKNHRMTAGLASGITMDGKLRPKVISTGNTVARYFRQMPANAYAVAVLRSQPLIYWRFESMADGYFSNEINERYDARLKGSLSLSDEDGEHAASFPGGLREAPYMIVDQPIGELANITDYTIEVWVKPDEYQRGSILTLYDPEVAAGGIIKDILHLELVDQVDQPRPGEQELQSRGIRFVHRNPPSSGGGSNIGSNTTYSVGQWNYIVVVKQKDQITLYLNGQNVGSVTEPTAIPLAPKAIIGRLPRGIFQYNSGENNVRDFHGQIDELAIYRRALTEQEIKEHLAKSKKGE